MVDPVSLATLSSFSTIASGAGKAISGLSQYGMYGYQSGIAALNAKIAKQNADYAASQGETQAAESGMRTAFEIGQTRARQGASNIAVGSGSPTDVVASERQIGNINQSIIRNNAARVAYGYETQAATESAQSQMYARAAPMALAGSLISAAGSVSDKWYGYQSSFGGASGAGLGTGGVGFDLNQTSSFY